MKALVRSTLDPAGMNIGSFLERAVGFGPAGAFDGHDVMAWGEWRLVTTDAPLITDERIDDRVAGALGEAPEMVVFLSRHRSESGARSLTVHPPGNHGEAEFGGEPRTLAPAAPHAMTTALRRLRDHARGLDYPVSFEVTHHGPALLTPAFFIEIGSGEGEWRDPAAGAAVAAAVHDVMRCVDVSPVVLVGVGGGHYAPRFTDLAVGRRVSFGHMVPSYHMEAFDAGMLGRAIAASGADGVYVHRKGLSGAQRESVRDAAAELGIRTFREADLEPMETQGRSR